MLAIGIMLIGTTLADEPSEPAPAPPLCRTIDGAVREGTRKSEVVGLIKASVAVTGQDLDCLRRIGAPDYAVRAAQARLIKLEGVEALPTGPVDVWAVLPDLRSIASAQSGVVGLGANVGLLLGFDEAIEQKVVDEVLSRARAALAEAGVPGDVALVPTQLPATTGVFWEGSFQRRAAIRAGTYYVLHVHIPDAVEAARLSAGDLVVKLGARAGGWTWSPS